VTSGSLSKLDRSVSVVLAVVFLVAGVAGITLGVIRSNLMLLAVSVLAAAWGTAWARVAWRGQLLGQPPSE